MRRGQLRRRRGELSEPGDASAFLLFAGVIAVAAVGVYALVTKGE